MSRFITPTYQANLNSAIRDVIIRLNHGYVYEAWEALQTLFYMLHPDVQKDCEEKLKQIRTQLKKILGDRDLDVAYTQAKQRRKIFRLLTTHNRELLGLIMKSLFEHGYLERKPKPIPTNIPEEFFTRQNE